jgi:glycosyltransferase involved in cell wall biosynthesis
MAFESAFRGNSMISVVIPALNEEANIRSTVRTIVGAVKECGDTPPDIIIVNDGSTDQTGPISDDLAREFPYVRVVHQPTNKGQGAAILEGLHLAKFPLMTMVPGDNELSYYTIKNLVLNRDKADYVLAMIINVERRSRGRIQLSAIFSHVYMTTFDLAIRYVNAPALWPVARLKEMGLRAQRYSLHAEINAKLLRQPITYVEVDGYMSPAVEVKSSALRIRNLLEVMRAYLRLCHEIFVTKKELYSHRATRILPPGVINER